MKIDTAIFTCYFPNSSFKDNLTLVSMQFDHVIVVANDGDIKHKDLEKINKNIHIIISDKNLGISAAYNMAVQFATNLASDYIFLFDQDTTISSDFRSKMHNLYAEISALGHELILGANYSNSKNEISLLKDSNEKFSPQYAIISSGSMMKIDDYYKIGCYNELLFIDYCDIDFCFKARIKGFKIYMTTQSFMYHDIGNYKEVDLKLLKLRYTEHNEFRVMYMFRNAVLVSKKYFFVFPEWVIMNLLKRIKSLILIMLIDKNKLTKLMAIFKGIRAGLINKY